MCDMDRLAKWHRWVAGGRQGPAPSLSGSDLRKVNLYSANLQGANLQGVDLYGADLRYATLRDASLRHANLQRANLRSADLYGADLYGANLRNANLRYANLRDTENAKELTANARRRCRLVVIRHDDGWHVFAGCWRFKTISEAIDYWSHSDYPDLDRGRRYVQALTDFAKEM